MGWITVALRGLAGLFVDDGSLALLALLWLAACGLALRWLGLRPGLGGPAALRRPGAGPAWRARCARPAAGRVRGRTERPGAPAVPAGPAPPEPRGPRPCPTPPRRRARGRTRWPRRARPAPRALATLAVGVTVVAALYFGQEVLVPIVLAVLLSFILAPVVGLLQRWRLGRVVPVIAAVLVALGVILALGSVVGVQLAQLATDLPRYQATIGRKVDALRAGALGRASDLAKEVGRKVQDAAGQAPAGAPAPAAAPPAGTPENPLTVRLSETPPAPVELARRVLEPVVHPLATLGIVLVVAIFILLQREDLRDRMIRLFGAGDLHRTTVAMDDAARRLSRYFLAQVGDQRRLRRPDRRWACGRSACRARSCGPSSRRCCASCPTSARCIAAALPVALAAAVDPRLVDGALDARPVRRRRGGDGPGRRAAGLRPQDRPVAVRGVVAACSGPGCGGRSGSCSRRRSRSVSSCSAGTSSGSSSWTCCSATARR